MWEHRKVSDVYQVVSLSMGGAPYTNLQLPYLVYLTGGGAGESGCWKS